MFGWSFNISWLFTCLKNCYNQYINSQSWVCVFVCMNANSQQIFIKFRFPESTWNYPSLGWKKSGKIRIPGEKPDFCAFFRIPEKKPDSWIFQILSEMVFIRYFMIIKCCSFFEIPIFKATVAIYEIARLRPPGWIRDSPRHQMVNQTKLYDVFNILCTIECKKYPNNQPKRQY